jgi:DNA-directed RNA polymerase specialized sigma subunit
MSLTPTIRRRKIMALASQVNRLTADVKRCATGADPLEQLAALNELAQKVESLRESFADVKGVLAAEAKATNTHQQIGERLGVSKPYVQQMVYRGYRLLRAA